MNPNGFHPTIASAGIQPFRLRLLGGLSLTHDNSVVEAKRSGLALLAVLASSGSSPVARDKLIGLLWPDTDEEHARASLKQTIYLLRRDLNREDLILGSTELRLNPEAVRSDRTDFEDASKRKSWLEAIDLYGGAFLDGVYLRSAPEFNRWVDSERAHLAEVFAHAMEQNAKDLEANGEYEAASRRWRALLADAPLSERFAEGAIRSLIKAGDRGLASAAYRAHAQATKADFGRDPDSSLSALLESTDYTHGNGAPAHAIGAAPQASDDPNPVEGTLDADAKEGPRRRRGLMIAATAIGVIAAAIAVFRYTQTAIAIDNRIVVAGFDNRSGDRSLDALGQMASDWITDGITRMGVVNVVDAGTAFSLTQEVRAQNPGGTTAVDRLAKAARAGTVISGSYYLRGDTLQFHARVTDPGRRSVRVAIEPVVVTRDSAMTGVELIRQHVLAIVAREFDDRLSTVLDSTAPPPKYEAYREYILGLGDFMNHQWTTAAAHFERAFEVDSTFAGTLLWAAITKFNSSGSRTDPEVGERDRVRARELLQMARDRRSLLSPLDRHGLQAMTIRGPRKLPDAWAAAKIAPQSHWAWNASLWTYNSLRPHQAIKMLLELDFERGWLKKFSGYDPLLASAYHMVGKYREEAQTLQRHAKRFPAEPALALWTARNAIALGDRKAAEEKTHLIPDQDLICEWSLLVDEYLIHGQKVEAQRLGAKMSAKLAVMSNVPSSESGCYVHSLYRLERYAELAAFLDSDRDQIVTPLDAAGMRGVLAARSGDKAGALKILRSLPDEMPSHFWRAQIASELGLKKEATDYLKIAYENGRRGVVEAHSPAHADREYFPRLRGYGPFEDLVSQAN